MDRSNPNPADPRERNHWELINNLLTRYAAEPGLRPNYTWSVMHAASVALRTNREAVGVVEIGVAGGTGLVRWSAPPRSPPTRSASPSRCTDSTPAGASPGRAIIATPPT